MFRRLATRTTSLPSASMASLNAFSGNVQRRWTTILSVRKGDTVCLIGDSQVTLGERIVAKATAKKLRRAGDSVMVGFAGSTADALTLMEKLEGKLKEFPDQLTRACVELAKEWRGDKMLRRLEASLIVCNKDETLEIDGSGNVITPEADGIVAIGSGGIYAKAAARALHDIDGLTAEQIARKSMKIATDLDVFSNNIFEVDIIGPDAGKDGAKTGDKKSADTSSSSNTTSGSTSASPSFPSSSTTSLSAAGAGGITCL